MGEEGEGQMDREAGRDVAWSEADLSQAGLEGVRVVHEEIVGCKA